MEQKVKNRGRISNKAGTPEKKMTVKAEESASFIPLEKPTVNDKGPRKRWPKKSRALKKPRLIVRNLSYKATEESVRKHFEKFGEITDVVLLRKPNKQLVGCGFVQFSKTNSAAKAIANGSGQEFMGRPIVVDWAVPKDQYVKKASGADDVKVEIKNEDDISQTNDNKKNLNESVTIDDDDSEEEDVKPSDIEDDEDEEDDDTDDDEYDDDEDEGESKPGKKSAGLKIKEENKKPKFESNDVTEGRTVFLRNLPFSVDNDQLHDFGEQFGPVLYAVVCMDPKSDHSRGTGFIKFQNSEDAKQCITRSQNKELVLENRTVDATPAISRDDAKKGQSKEKVKKDNRNIYLLREGLVTAGSTAAEGVSPSDMEKRIQLERWKTKTLRDLTMFVSQVRLVIHNLPSNYTDSHLRALFLKHGGFKPRITEARVMRDLKNVDANGVGRSKEYGFVTFTNHENALEALRSINNNPNVFTATKRPIVSFSIEDKKMLNVRKRRQERSLMKNPTWKHYKKEEKKEGGEGDSKNKRPNNNRRKRNDKTNTGDNKQGGQNQIDGKTTAGNKRKNSTPSAGPQPKVARPFMGAVGKQGEGGTVSMRKLRDQSEVVKQKAKDKKKKSRQNKKPERIKQPKQPKKEKESKDNFNDMVNKYKASLAGATATAAQSKWYE